MDTLIARRSQRTSQRATNAPTSPYESGGPWYEFSATVDFASTAAGAASAAIDVAAPAGLTFTVGNQVEVATPGAVAAGCFISGKVKTGGAFVTLQLINSSGGTVDAASATVQIRVAKG